MTVARILFPLPLPEPFDYAVPEGVSVVPGSYVRAPLGAQERTGVVWALADDAAGEGRSLKALSEVYPAPPMTDDMRAFIDWASKYTVSAPGQVLAMALRARGGLSPSPVETIYRVTGEAPQRLTPARAAALAAASRTGPASAAEIAAGASVSSGVVKGLAAAGALIAETRPVDAPFETPRPGAGDLALTAEQAAAADALHAAVTAGGFRPFLLDGVTGSGKTEVYFEAIAALLEARPEAQTLVLLPEIALTQAVLDRFEARFGAKPAQWHSGLSDKQRRRTWREVAGGRARIVIGARSALFLPFARLGLIIKIGRAHV